MQRSLALMPVLLFLAFAPSAYAVERVELENGLTVLLEPLRSAPAVSVSAYLRAGRVFEPESKGGISHFTEHMMFRATGRRPEGNAEREVWKAGGRMIAYTREDYTEYGVLLPSSRADLALDVVSDYLLSASFLLAEVAEEKKIVLDEIQMRAANVQTSSYESLQEMGLLPHLYGKRIAGSVQSVSSITRDDLLAYYRSRYRPDRAALVVVGDFDRKEMLGKVRRWFGGWKRSDTPLPDPPPIGRSFGHYQEVVQFREGASPFLITSVSLPGYLHQDYLASLFLRPILSGWLSSRLVVEQRVALAADSYHSTLAPRNFLTVRLTLAGPEDASRARDALLALLADVARPGFSFQSVPRVAGNLRAREALVTEDFQRYASVIGKAAMYGYYPAEGRPANLAAEDRYSGISEEEVARVARTYLKPENMRVLFVLPPGSTPPKAAVLERTGSEPSAHPVRIPAPTVPYDPPAEERARRESTPPRDSDATRITLDTGTVFLHLERHGADVVAGSIVFRAGSRYDPAGKEGLAKLTMETVSISTVGEKDDSPRWRLFTLGHDVDFTVHRDVATVSFSVPADRVPEAISTIARMLREPSLSTQAIEEARGRLMRSARQETERVGQFAGNRFRAAIYAGTPSGHERYGTRESLANLTAADVRAFYHRHLDLSRSVVAIVGAVAPRRARALVRRATAPQDEPRAGSPSEPQDTYDWPESPRELRLSHPSGRTYLILGNRAPGMSGRLSAETALLRLALGWRVFTEFTDIRSTAYEAGTFYRARSQGGDFGLYVGTTREYAHETLRVLREILAAAARDGLSEELVDDARRAWLGGADLNRMRAVDTARRLAHREATGLGFASFERHMAAIAGLDAADLKRACAAIFPGGKAYTLLVNVPRPR